MHTHKGFFSYVIHIKIPQTSRMGHEKWLSHSSWCHPMPMASAGGQPSPGGSLWSTLLQAATAEFQPGCTEFQRESGDRIAGHPETSGSMVKTKGSTCSTYFLAAADALVQRRAPWVVIGSQWRYPVRFPTCLRASYHWLLALWPFGLGFCTVTDSQLTILVFLPVLCVFVWFLRVIDSQLTLLSFSLFGSWESLIVSWRSS